MLRRTTFITIGLCLIALLGWLFAKPYLYAKWRVGEVVDELNGVKVYYNGSVSHVEGRNIAKNGYNLGLKYQCVEFVKRYYFEHLHHQMPNSYGHAKDFFDKKVKDGAKNKARNLLQYRNPSNFSPQVNDLVIFDGHLGNPFGHVAIISKVTAEEVEIIQQNPGIGASSREKLKTIREGKKWRIDHDRVLGWQRKEKL